MERKKIQIEAPTAEQKSTAKANRMIHAMETGASEEEVRAALRKDGLLRSQADALIPKLRKASAAGRRRNLGMRIIAGWVLMIIGFGSGIMLLGSGIITFGAFSLGLLGAGLVFGGASGS